LADEGGVTVVNPPARRMTLRQLLTHTEKSTRDLIGHFQSTMMASLADFRDLSRPVRRRSHYPSMVALLNSLNKVQQVCKETGGMADYLQSCLKDIREHARRDRLNRV
jgi:hypothetical protein